MKNIWESDGVGSPEPGSRGKIKYQQYSAKSCTTTDLEIDGLYHVGKLNKYFYDTKYITLLGK